jgi:hypothetical protein
MNLFLLPTVILRPRSQVGEPRHSGTAIRAGMNGGAPEQPSLKVRLRRRPLPASPRLERAHPSKRAMELTRRGWKGAWASQLIASLDGQTLDGLVARRLVPPARRSRTIGPAPHRRCQPPCSSTRPRARRPPAPRRAKPNRPQSTALPQHTHGWALLRIGNGPKPASTIPLR